MVMRRCYAEIVHGACTCQLSGMTVNAPHCNTANVNPDTCTQEISAHYRYTLLNAPMTIETQCMTCPSATPLGSPVFSLFQPEWLPAASTVSFHSAMRHTRKKFAMLACTLHLYAWLASTNGHSSVLCWAITKVKHRITTPACVRKWNSRSQIPALHVMRCNLDGKPLLLRARPR